MKGQTEQARKGLCALGTRMQKINGSLPVVDRNSVAWNEWWRWRKDAGLPVVFMESREAWTVPTETPPADLQATLQRAGGGGIKGRLNT